MPNVTQFAAWEGMILVSGLCGIVLWKLMTGGISLNCLLYGDARAVKGGGRKTYFSAGRAQMLMITVVSAGYFLLQVIQDPTHFPDVPTPVLIALGGSSAIYLGGKAQALYLGRFRDLAASLDRRGQQQ
jgi:hypothetical protein